LSVRNKKGPVPETRIWLLKASMAKGFRGISAISFGALEAKSQGTTRVRKGKRVALAMQA